MLNWKFWHKITVLKTWFFDIKEVTIYHSVETKEIMLSWKFWHKIAFLWILFCFNPFLEQRKLQFFVSVETRNNVELKVLAQDRISQNTILLKPLLQQRKLKFNTRLKQKIMLANTRNHDSHNMVLFQPLWHKGSLHLTLGWKKILLYSWRFPATKFFTCSRSVFSVSFCLGNLGTLTRGGEMGEFSPPFFWAPFFLFCFWSLKYWLVLIHYCKNSPPISKSWIRACLYLLR